MTNIPYGDAGIASFEVSDNFTTVELFNSAIPHPVTEDFPVAENSNFPVNSVVGVDANGNLAMAKTSATAVVPLGVTTVAVVTGAGVTDRIAIYRAGNFNPAALNWHADYDTMAKKKAAFRGSPTPTNIILRERL